MQVGEWKVPPTSLSLFYPHFLICPHFRSEAACVLTAAPPPLPLSNLPTLVDPSTLQVSGCVRLDGRDATPDQLSRACASVPQHELLLPCLSVEECLRYSAAVRLGPVVSAQQAKQRVDEVMQVGSVERGRRWGRGGGGGLEGEERIGDLDFTLVGPPREEELDLADGGESKSVSCCSYPVYM